MNKYQKQLFRFLDPKIKNPEDLIGRKLRIDYDDVNGQVEYSVFFLITSFSLTVGSLAFPAQHILETHYRLIQISLFAHEKVEFHISIQKKISHKDSLESDSILDYEEENYFYSNPERIQSDGLTNGKLTLC